MTAATLAPPVRLQLRPYQDTLPARIMDRLAVEYRRPMATPCLVFTGRLVNGYGSAKIDGKERKLHRTAWLLIVGPLDPYDEANTYRLPSRPNVRYCRACNNARRNARRAAGR